MPNSQEAGLDSGGTQTHVCVLCNSKLGSKEELQEHFRKHANREIDGKGRVRLNKRIQNQNAPANQQIKIEGTKPPETSKEKTEEPVKPKIPPPVSGSGEKKPGKQLVTCDVCGQEFDSVTIAIQHKFRKHPDSAIKHFCPHCGQQFPLKINRDRHLLTHPSVTPSKMFPCKDCGVVFYNLNAQNYHFKSTHKRIVSYFRPVATPPPSKKIKVNNAGEAQSVYYCHLCGFEYIVKFNLQKHLEKQHPEKEREAMPTELIKCTTCDAFFYNKKAYEVHNMYHRPDDLYVTSEEQRLQTVTRVDQDFDIRRVQMAVDKYIPSYRSRPSASYSKGSKYKDNNNTRSGLKHSKNEDGSNSELSPDSETSDSDSDSDVPLSCRIKKWQTKTKKLSKKNACKGKNSETKLRKMPARTLTVKHSSEEKPDEVCERRVTRLQTTIKTERQSFVKVEHVVDLFSEVSGQREATREIEKDEYSDSDPLSL